jgi:hypothetical protein
MKKQEVKNLFFDTFPLVPNPEHVFGPIKKKMRRQDTDAWQLQSHAEGTTQKLQNIKSWRHKMQILTFLAHLFT